MMYPTNMQNVMLNSLCYGIQYTKKSNKIDDLKIYIVISMIWHFCIAHYAKYFKLTFYMFVGHIMGNIQNFC
jgi:hypothetical protein